MVVAIDSIQPQGFPSRNLCADQVTFKKSGLPEVRLSATAVAKLRAELKRLASSSSPKTLEFANRMLDRYPELKDVSDGGDV